MVSIVGECFVSFLKLSAMKILMTHNDYGRYSGEEAVVDRLIADFQEMGHTVEQLRLSSATSRNTLGGNIRGFFAGIYSFRGVRLMRQKLREFQPDVVHVHNLYPFISPAALFECRKSGVRVIMTVHNYRLMCPTGLFLRNGAPCEDCLRSGCEWGCIRHNCEQSWLRSIGYATRNSVARILGAYTKNVDTFCCLTEFQKRKLLEAGFPEEKLTVLPNYFEGNFAPSATGSYVGYVGRLSSEKGYDLLLEVARRHPEIAFRFAGDKREDAVVAPLPNVEYAGRLDKDALESFYREARFIVIPSRCYEGFPLVIPEAFSHGLPVIGPHHGPFPNLISNGGVTFTPQDTDDLERSIVALWGDDERCQQLGTNAHALYQQRYSKKVVLEQWRTFLNSIDS